LKKSAVMPKKNKRRGGGNKQPAKNSNNAGNTQTSASTASSGAKRAQPDAFIIAIDFGTTYSGIAWNYTSSGNTQILRDWPNQSSSSNKVPTTLRYSEKKGIQWGHVRPSPERLEWFKLLLNEPNYRTPDELLQRLKTKGLHGYPESASTHLAALETTIKTIPPGKKPVDLAADYLRELYKWAKLKLEESYPSLQEDLGREGGVVVKCCLTVPAIWDDKAKELTRQAAIQAGIDGNGVYMISEPEAAAVHCLTALEAVKGNLKVDNVYVIVDCGGGTVDLIAYQVCSIDPLQVMECNVGSGELCGSTLINRRFEDLVIRLIGQQAYDKMEDDDRIEMRDYFDKETKPKFFPSQGNDDEDDEEDEGVICSLPGVPDMDDPKLGIRVRRTKITIPTKDMEGVFEPVFVTITTLVQEQVTAAQKATGRNVDAVMLVGGFGSSNYLAKWLEKNVRNKDDTPVRLIRPLDPSTAIVDGAVQHGVDQHKAGNTSSWGIVKSRKARYHYGISVSVLFRPVVHPIRKRYIDPFTGYPMCRGRMHWAIKKGENMHQGVGIEGKFHCSVPIIDSTELQKACLIADQIIYASADEPAPEDVEHPNVHKLLTYVSDFSTVPTRHFERDWAITGRPYWNIPATFSIKLESADLVFTTLVAKQVIGEGKKLYHHEELAEKGPQMPIRRRGWFGLNNDDGDDHELEDDDGDNEENTYEHEYDPDGW